MGFRERLEYQEWRNEVLKLFGRKCILCGHEGNIHVHHVKPVNTYPELVFEATNGVPLCGNCHALVNGDEFAYVDKLEQRQQSILNGQSLKSGDPQLNEEELRRAAEADPCNIECVTEWFSRASNPQAVVDFFTTHHRSIPKTPSLLLQVAAKYEQLLRWRDVMRAGYHAQRAAEEEGTLRDWLHAIADKRCDAVARLEELQEQGDDKAKGYPLRVLEAFVWDRMFDYAVYFLQRLLSMFPNDGHLHYLLSRNMWDATYQTLVTFNRDIIIGHAEKSVELSPSSVNYSLFASHLHRQNDDLPSALKYGRHALSQAQTNEEKVKALNDIARTFCCDEQCSETRRYCRKVLEVDEHNIEAISWMAQSYEMEENYREAKRWAKLGLMIDPTDENCKSVLYSIDLWGTS